MIVAQSMELCWEEIKYQQRLGDVIREVVAHSCAGHELQGARVSLLLNSGKGRSKVRKPNWEVRTRASGSCNE